MMNEKKMNNCIIAMLIILIIIVTTNTIRAKYMSKVLVTNSLNIISGEYKLIFDSNGGTIDNKSTFERAISTGDTYGKLPLPIKAGYTHLGWYTDLDDGKKINEDDIVESKDTTIYAHWKANKLTIKYHNDGATYIEWGGNNNPNVEGKDVTTIQTEIYGTNFSNGINGLYDSLRWKRTGYETKRYCWKIGKDGTVEYDDSKGFTKAEDCAEYLGVLEEFEKGDVIVDLYPIWIANTYTIKYDKNSNDASGSMDSSKHTYDVKKKLTSNEFSRDGFTFSGWNENANGSGTSYEDGESVLNLTSVNNGIITLYAQWKSNN